MGMNDGRRERHGDRGATGTRGRGAVRVSGGRSGQIYQNYLEKKKSKT